MNPSKTILISITLLVTSITVLAGCTTFQTANTNTATTTVVVNTNETANTEQGSEIDTSDWLTYTNEAYKFSVSYPKDWTIWTDYNPSTEEYSFDSAARRFTLMQSSQLSKDQDFTPGINILIKTDDEMDSLITELEKDNEGSSKTKVDGIDAFVFNKVDIVYEQMTIVPEKNMQVIVRVDENYEMSDLFRGIYSSIQF